MNSSRIIGSCDEDAEESYPLSDKVVELDTRRFTRQSSSKYEQFDDCTAANDILRLGGRCDDPCA